MLGFHAVDFANRPYASDRSDFLPRDPPLLPSLDPRSARLFDLIAITVREGEVPAIAAWREPGLTLRQSCKVFLLVYTVLIGCDLKNGVHCQADRI
jgi:hypothetical protein